MQITNSILSSKQKKQLKDKGYIVFKSIPFMKDNVRLMRSITKKLINKEGHKGGWEGKEKFYKKGKHFEKGTSRLGNLINKHKIFSKLIEVPEILKAAHEVIGSNIKVSGLNLRSPLKNAGRQRIHMDWKPRKNKNQKFAGVVCFVFLDNANKSNGALRLIPGTHKKLGWPEQYTDVMKKHKKEILMSVRAGTIIVANLNLWHAGSNNKSGKERKMIMINIKNRKLPQLINYKKYLNSKVKNNLNDFQKYLLAVRKNDPTQKFDSVGVGKYYKDNFNLKKKVKLKIMLQENKIKSLYEDGLVNFNSFFEKDLLQELVVAKENLFNEYPYGQDDKLNKKTKSDFVRPVSYMIWDVIEKTSFAKILENKFIKEIATRVLGANYTVGSFYIRKTPKINEKLNPHIDYQGGLSFSILLDDINLNQGETFFYKESHKLPPPSFIDFKKFKKIPHSITGKVGDTFFWFPDCWHGRNINSNEKETTILMCHLGNACYPNSDATGRKVNYSIKKKIKIL